MTGVLQKNPEVVYREFREEGIQQGLLYDPTLDKVYALNRSAFLIFQLCDGNHMKDQIKEEIRKQYLFKQDTEDKIDATINHLLQQKLVEYL